MRGIYKFLLSVPENVLNSKSNLTNKIVYVNWCSEICELPKLSHSRNTKSCEGKKCPLGHFRNFNEIGNVFLTFHL